MVKQYFVPTSVFGQVIEVDAASGVAVAPTTAGTYRAIAGVLAASSLTVSPGVAVNTAVPTIDSQAYPGGSFTITQGSWTGSTSLALMVQSSADGISGWSDEASYGASGVWAAGLENKYVRARVTATPGSVIAYSAVLPIGIAYDQVLDHVNNSNYLTTTVTAPPLGASLTAATSGAAKGLWLSAMWYFSGSGFKQGRIISFTDGTNDSSYTIELCPSAAVWRNGHYSDNILAAPVAAGWYITTVRLWSNGGTNAGTTVYFENLTPVSSGDAGSGGVDLSTFDTFWEARGHTNDNAAFSDVPVAWIAAGRGDPAAAHAWTYNSGKKRIINDYDFAGDANASIDVFKLYSRKSPGNTTFTTAQIADSRGTLGTPTLTGTMAWLGRVPGFINPAGDPPATPAAFISPRYATTADTTLTIGINTKNIGDALAGDLTISSLTHSVAGNIAGTVSGDTFANPGAGTITGTINGVAVNCEIITPATIPANPQFWSRYNENALVAAIEEYPTYGAGTTYGSIAAMKAGIDALGSGATLTIENLTEAGTLTLTAKDYGGATLRCRFRHGVVINKIVMDGVENLTLRGFSALGGGGSGGFGGNPIDGNITLDHCTGTGWFFIGANGATENITVTNWIGPEDGTATTSGVALVNSYTARRVAHGATSIVDPGTADAHRAGQINKLIMERCWNGDVRGNNPLGHYDGFQTFLSGTTGVTEGLILNCVITDRNLSGETPLSGAFFVTGINAQGLRIKNCAATTGTYQDITIGAARQNCQIEDTTASGPTLITAAGSLTYSSLANNNVMGTPGNVLGSGGLGVETNTYASTVMATQYPDWATYQDSWRRLRNPTAPFNTRGAYALIAELEAKRLTL